MELNDIYKSWVEIERITNKRRHDGKVRLLDKQANDHWIKLKTEKLKNKSKINIVKYGRN